MAGLRRGWDGCQQDDLRRESLDFSLFLLIFFLTN